MDSDDKLLLAIIAALGASLAVLIAATLYMAHLEHQEAVECIKAGGQWVESACYTVRP